MSPDLVSKYERNYAIKSPFQMCDVLFENWQENDNVIFASYDVWNVYAHFR